jgi:hypothetical protein
MAADEKSTLKLFFAQFTKSTENKTSNQKEN